MREWVGVAKLAVNVNIFSMCFDYFGRSKYRHRRRSFVNPTVASH